ncbi:hypothetical protein BDB13_4125 [Rhodococcus sp. OK302]|nr:hypothetical protein BDB13_4125 [Rhodococcus sp. OK302]
MAVRCVAASLAAHNGPRRVRSLGTHVPSRGARPYLNVTVKMLVKTSALRSPVISDLDD